MKPTGKEEVARNYVEEKTHSANVFNEQNEESKVKKTIQAEMNHFEIAEEVLDSPASKAKSEVEVPEVITPMDFFMKSNPAAQRKFGEKAQSDCIHGIPD